MDIETHRKLVAEAMDHEQEGRHDKALELTERLLQVSPFAPDLLVRRARLLRLARDGGTLDEIEQTLVSACTASPNHVPALLELGRFLYGTHDANDRALPYFERAEELAAEMLKDALIYQIKCLLDMGQKDKAAEMLAYAQRRLPSDLQIYDLDDMDTIW